jgi:hypothetical protein
MDCRSEWERVLEGKPEGKRPLGRPKGRLGNNTKLDLEFVDCIALTQGLEK